jgi:hypothetical protein
MANRFGRNQRRKMRDEIARQGRVLDEAFDNIDRQTRSARRAWEAQARQERWFTDWASRIYAIVGPGSAFAAEIKGQEIEAEWFDLVARCNHPHRLRPAERFSLASVMESRAMPVAHAEQIVEAFAFFVERHENIFDHRQVVTLHAPSGKLALAMDARTFHDLKERAPNVLARHFYEKLIAAFFDEKKPRSG